jgi:5-methylcytosine-specific restriction endonuclease McrA
MDKQNFAIFYSIYLNSNYWQRLRAEKLDSVGHKCERCGTTKTLQVHHKTYYRNGEDILYHETLDDLECLCRACHEQHHHIKYKQRKLRPAYADKYTNEYNDKKYKKKKPYRVKDKYRKLYANSLFNRKTK